ncbi:MAG TPA: Uma2 family endonuclease [Acidimicrobiales bacterium]|nr:Uma2 family endonuclease [Acidimicrobiales bacterium]
MSLAVAREGRSFTIDDLDAFPENVLVVRRDSVRGAEKATTPPLLVVEVLSASTRLLDLGSKRLAYREGGVGAYWIADPVEPRVTAVEWSGDGEAERTAAGAEALEFRLPFPVRVHPQALIDG